MLNTRYVIIGNSAAALSAIRAIRKKDWSSSITLVSAENCNAYSPVLTTYYIGHKINRNDLFVTDAQFYQDLHVQTKFGSKVTGIETDKQVIHIEDNGIVEYDKLLIATGASPQRNENTETDAFKYVSALRTIEDADKISKLCEKANEIVILGAGLVSLQITEAVLKEGRKVTLIVGSNQILSQNLDAEIATIVQKKLESLGVSFRFNQQVHAITRENDHACVVLESGEKLEADLVAIGKGINPNIDFLADSNIKVNRGILVDQSMRTNVENVFAAGDVAEGNNSLSGKSEIIATWPNACAQGEVAGFNMASYPTRRESQFKENITTVMGLPIALIGLSRTKEELKVLQYSDHGTGVYRRILIDNNHVVGVVLLGDSISAGVFKYCIENKIDISPWGEHIVSNPPNFAEIIHQQLTMAKPGQANLIAAWPADDFGVAYPTNFVATL